MRYADLFGKTKREALAELSDPTKRLAYRAGLLLTRYRAHRVEQAFCATAGQQPQENRQLLWLPLAARVFARMQEFLRVELERIGAQELRGTPHVDLETLAGQEIQSYKQLPARLYWWSGGMTRLHLAALTTNTASAAEGKSFSELFNRFCEWLDVTPRYAQDSATGDAFYILSADGDTELLHCEHCQYLATAVDARPYKTLEHYDSERLPLQEVATPHCETIEALARFLGVPTHRTAKAVFYSGDGKLIFAVVRGDLNVSEDKLKRALGVNQLRLASDAEITRVGAVPGYASPIGVRGATIIVDTSVAETPNLVAGANREGYHFLNTNLGRDYQADQVLDIALARPGDRCPNGDGQLALVRGMELDAVLASRELAATYLDANGRACKLQAFEGRLDLGVALLAHVGTHNDEKGIVWRRALAPFDLYIVALNADRPDVAAALRRVTAELERAGWSFLLDDRNESAGVKFNDADLIGLPLRLTVGPKTVAQNAVEFKTRAQGEVRMVPLEALGQFLARDSVSDT